MLDGGRGGAGHFFRLYFTRCMLSFGVIHSVSALTAKAACELLASRAQQKTITANPEAVGHHPASGLPTLLTEANLTPWTQYLPRTIERAKDRERAN
jgi:hypothetical protein